jgi:ankyrin repeat protein
MNALHLAVLSKKNFIVTHVAQLHPELLNSKDERGNSPIHLAAKECSTEILDNLILQKSDVNVLNKDGNSPLHVAVSNGCFASVSMLIEAGSDIGRKNNQNLLASDLISTSYRIDKNERYVLSKKLRAPASEKK